MSDPRRDPPEPSEPSSLSRLRDFDKVRERMVLRIEVRHIVQVAVLVLGLAAAAFVGGWMAGRHGWQPTWLSALDSRRPTQEPEVAAPLAPVAPLAVAAAAPETAAPTPTVAEAAAPGEQVVVAAGDPAASTDAAADADLALAASMVVAQAAPQPPAAEPVANPPAQPAPPAPAAAEAVASADAAKAEAARETDDNQPAPAAPGKKGGKQAAKGKGDKAAEGKTDAAGEKAAEKTGEKTADAQPPRAGRPAAGKYMVQIKAFRNEAEATAFADELRQKGYTVSVSTVEVPEKGQFFRVRLGPFGTLDAARAAQKRLESAEGHATIILSVP